MKRQPHHDHSSALPRPHFFSKEYHLWHLENFSTSLSGHSSKLLISHPLYFIPPVNIVSESLEESAAAYTKATAKKCILEKVDVKTGEESESNVLQVQGRISSLNTCSEETWLKALRFLVLLSQSCFRCSASYMYLRRLHSHG